jgi:hypothetical protein
MRRELINGTFIQADETPVKEQMQDDRGKNHQASYGSMADREERWCSTSVWAADATGRGRFWDSSKGTADEALAALGIQLQTRSKATVTTTAALVGTRKRTPSR